MRVLSVEPKEICVTVELKLTEVRHILNFFDKSNVEYNSKEEPSMVEATEYVKNKFFKTLDSIYEEFNKGR